MLKIKVRYNGCMTRGGGKSLKVEMPESEVYYPTVKFLYMDVVKTRPQKVQTVELEKVVAEPVETAEPESAVLANAVQKIDEPEQKQRGAKKWRSRLGAAVVAIIAMVAVVLVGLRLAGFRTFTVMSGSMDPEYPVGSLIYVKPVDYKSRGCDFVCGE